MIARRGRGSNLVFVAEHAIILGDSVAGDKLIIGHFRSGSWLVVGTRTPATGHFPASGEDGVERVRPFSGCTCDRNCGTSDLEVVIG